MDVEVIWTWFRSCWKRFHAALSKLFAPAVKLGNPDRALKKGERDGNDEQLTDLNRTWREMLKEDPWMKKLMTHVALLTQASFMFFLAFFVCGLTLRAKHPIFNFIIAGFFATIPYWFWVGRWYGKIEQKVFAEFKKRFGKHFHLK